MLHIIQQQRLCSAARFSCRRSERPPSSEVGITSDVSPQAELREISRVTAHHAAGCVLASFSTDMTGITPANLEEPHPWTAKIRCWVAGTSTLLSEGCRHRANAYNRTARQAGYQYIDWLLPWSILQQNCSMLFLVWNNGRPGLRNKRVVIILWYKPKT